jgi:hypothetical protein
MTPQRQHAVIRKVKEITLGSSLLLSLLAGNTLVLQSCGNGQNGAEGEYEEVEAYKKGVKIYLNETAAGVFKITDEQETDVEHSMVQITYLDGHSQTLTAEQAKQIIDAELQSNKAQIGKTDGLANAMLYSGMGYLLAKTMAPNYSQYRPDMQPQVLVNKADSTHKTHVYHNRGHFFPLLFWRYYSSPAVFDRSTAVHNSINNSRFTTHRPVGGRSGFFRSTGRTSFRS